MYLDIANKADFSACEFFVSDRGIRITGEEIKEKSLMICDKKDDWSDFSHLQIKMYSENASETVIEFFVLTDKKDDGSYGGYVYLVTVSWSGEHVIACPLKYGIVTHNNPTKGLDNVLGVMVTPFHGGVAPGKTEVYIDKIWVTNEPLKDRERFIECDENEDYFVEGIKRQRIDAISMLKGHSPDKKHPRLIMTEKDFSDLKAEKSNRIVIWILEPLFLTHSGRDGCRSLGASRMICPECGNIISLPDAGAIIVSVRRETTQLL